MGDFAAPAAAANGSSICINNNLNSGLSGAGGAGIGVNNTPHGPPAAAPSNNNTNSGGGIPKHSTVVERLRQRIEGCRRHHINCESRYQQAQAEQLELERRDTVSLYQRTLEQRAKKSGTGGGGGSSKQQHQSKQQQDAESATAEQRNHTLIMVRDGDGAVAVRLELLTWLNGSYDLGGGLAKAKGESKLYSYSVGYRARVLRRLQVGEIYGLVRACRDS
ncbi:hypothetical protein KIL84_001018 [Mauremys mutica]|uniref:Neurogenic mastermind-like N-terminal domain-containing protein n=1 Tax=Mauremys mutica TaxID=74926 RepID=A0A9D3WZ82_9SAUR|nr:hypothetical protein KIL84_001018 [Mauremys mutica]